MFSTPRLLGSASTKDEAPDEPTNGSKNAADRSKGGPAWDATYTIRNQCPDDTPYNGASRAKSCRTLYRIVRPCLHVPPKRVPNTTYARRR